MIKLDTDFNIDIAAFFRWWKSELTFLVPAKLRLLGGGKGNKLFIRVIGFEVELTLMVDNHTETLGSFTLDNNGASRLKELFEERPELKSCENILLLGRAQAIRKTIALPNATEENLNQVINYELDRFTPFVPEQLYFDFSVIGRNREASQIIVELVCTPKWKLEILQKEMDSLGLKIEAARYYERGQDNSFLTGNYNLLPYVMRPKLNKGPRNVNIALIFCLLGLLITALVFPVVLENRIEAELIEKISVVQKKTKEVENLQLEADDVLGNAERVVQIKESLPSMVIVIDEVTRLLPDNTWLKSFQYANGKLQIQGISSSASALIAILEASQLFNNTRFVSPVTQDRSTGLERFQIATQLKGSKNAG